jgi:hypothetical protein
LVVPTGRIVACDPFYCPDTLPFTVEVAAGAYPVVLCLAQFPRTGDERIAAAMLRVQSTPAVRWEWAICQARDDEGDTARAAAAEEAECEPGSTYCVDSGFGSFMDEAAIDALFDRAQDDEWDGEDAADYLQQRLDAQRLSGGAEWFNVPLDETSGVNMLIFTSGWGDGGHPSYWGFDAHGRPSCLLTDFGVLDDAELF